MLCSGNHLAAVDLLAFINLQLMVVVVAAQVYALYVLLQNSYNTMGVGSQNDTPINRKRPSQIEIATLQK